VTFAVGTRVVRNTNSTDASPESIQCNIEDEAISPSYDLATFPPPPIHSPVSKLDRRHTGRLRMKHSLLTGGGGGEVEGASSYDGEKPCSL
jgi:hypothetical protein